MSFELLCWLIGISAAVALWLHHTNLSRRAQALARRHIEGQGLQFLDQSAVLCRLRIGRTRFGGLCVVRIFEFEFSVQGDRRYRGWIRLVGNMLDGIELQPFREPPQTSRETP